MTKAELVQKIYNKYNGYHSKRFVTEMVDNVFTTVVQAIKEDKKFTYPHFGTWSVRKRKARKGRNPQTGEAIRIKASKTVGFKPSPKLKGSL